MNTSEIIKSQRLLNQLTQEELGRAIGVKKAAIQKYEKGTVKNLKAATINKLADVLGVSKAYLMGWEDEFGMPTPAAFHNLPQVSAVQVSAQGHLVPITSEEEKAKALTTIHQATLAAQITKRLELPETAEEEIVFFFQYLISKYGDSK